MGITTSKTWNSNSTWSNDEIGIRTQEKDRVLRTAVCPRLLSVRLTRAWTFGLSVEPWKREFPDQMILNQFSETRTSGSLESFASSNDRIRSMTRDQKWASFTPPRVSSKEEPSTKVRFYTRTLSAADQPIRKALTCTMFQYLGFTTDDALTWFTTWCNASAS